MQHTSRRRKLLKAGWWLLILGTGPVLLIGGLSSLGFPVSDNPIGLVFLAMLTFPVAITLLIVGALMSEK